MADIESQRVTAVIASSLDRLTLNARDRLRLLEVGKERWFDLGTGMWI
jgi:hypothetical protein